MMLHNRINDVEPGHLLRVVATDRSTTREIPRFCQFLGHELVKEEEQGGEVGFLSRGGEV